MTRGYRNSIGDADDQFDPDIVGDGPSAGFMRGADGSATRYAAARYGQPGAAIGVRDQNGNDMGPQWCKKGTASYSIAGLNGRTFSASVTALTNQTQVWANASVSLRSDGTWIGQGNTNQGAVRQGDPSSGGWLTRGSVGDFQVLMEITASSGYSGYSTSSSATNWTSLTQGASASVSLPSFPGNNTTTRNASATVRIRIRDASTGGVVSDNTVYLSISTTGFV